MDALKAAGLCALLVSPQQVNQPCTPPAAVSSPLIDRWQALITEAAQRFAIPENWIRAVMRRESGGLTMLDGKPITSHAGAMGLMQLMPGTWSGMRDRYGLGTDPYAPRDNILAGAAYLSEMFDHYGYPNLFAAYHAGPGRLNAFLEGQKPLPETTKTYLQSLVPGIEIAPFGGENRFSKDSISSPNSLFFMRSEGKNPSSEPSKSDPKSAKSESNFDESHDEIAPSSVGDSTGGESPLFVPLSRPAQ